MEQSGSREVRFCQRCGEKNAENNYRCRKCGFLLHGSAQQAAVVVGDNTLGGLIPVGNPRALWAYYLGVFSLIPLAGIPLGIAGVVLGVQGLKWARAHPEARGKAHAWTGILLGGSCAAIYSLSMALVLVLTALK